ncbi:ArsR/SmtB family transcription factor [Nocardioides sp.]|uniref:ArsR/SmtB family transcription factor n=1 Tax=Nocardioides sp. TaxID=35761 RepID=UPI003567A0CF
MPERRLSDPRELSALAHPLRIAIIEQLSLDGPLTATELGERLDESPANCSWHLRKLAAHGLVEEAPSQGGRRRPWQVPSIGFSWLEGDDSPETRRAGHALSELVMSRSLDRLREAYARAADEPEEWRSASDGTQAMLWLTAEELRDLNLAVRELLTAKSFLARMSDPGARPSGARLCEIVSWGAPTYLPGQEPTP